MGQVDFDAVEAQVLALSDALQGADEDTVAAEVVRLKALAAQIPDERSRRLALIRAEKLPELISGPGPGTSPQYHRAASLVTQVINDEGSPADQIERAITEIAALAGQAPQREFRTILRMNSTLRRLIERRRSEGLDGGS